MTPTAQDLLNACIMTLATPPRPEDAGMFAAARLRLVALTNKLAALEAANAAAIRVRENAAHGASGVPRPDPGAGRRQACPFSREIGGAGAWSGEPTLRPAGPASCFVGSGGGE